MKKFNTHYQLCLLQYWTDFNIYIICVHVYICIYIYIKQDFSNKNEEIRILKECY